MNLDWSWYAVETFLSDEPHTHFILSDKYSRESTHLSWFLWKWKTNKQQINKQRRKRVNIYGLHADIYRLISLRLGMMIDTTITLTFLQAHSCIWKQKNLHSLSGKFLNAFPRMKCGMLPQGVSPFKHMMNFLLLFFFFVFVLLFWFGFLLVCMNNMQERGPYVSYVVKNLFKAGLHSDACKLISYKLGLMTDMTSFCC